MRLPRYHNSHDRLQAVLINTSGGLTGGDDMCLKIDIGEKAKVSFTTQACEKFYKSTETEFCHIDNELNIAANASALWLPQESILFRNSHVRRKLRVNLAKNAQVMLAETLIFGRSSSGEIYDKGRLHDDWDITYDGQLIHSERLRINGENPLMNSSAGLSGHKALSTLVLIGGALEH